ncbi:MAG: 6-carboxytetrahydropterin synthase [Candidatus Bathyarchaeota archaeon]|nr:6-carboxytetrahydropterin synthase [Candidatus Bathyarchaeota archaeon]
MARNLIVGAEMYRLRIEAKFDAAHKIEGYEGKCAKLHGHTYKVEAFFLAKDVDATGISVDQRVLKEKLRKITDCFDHSFLNEFKDVGNPSMENLARYIFQNMNGLPTGIVIEKVRVWETPTSWCEYFEC